MQSIYNKVGKPIAIGDVSRPAYDNKCVYLLQFHHKTVC